MNIELKRQNLHYRDVLDHVLDNGVVLEASPSRAGDIGLTATHDHIIIVPTVELDSTVQVSPLRATKAERYRS
jgi:hypothetical protein